MGYYLVHLDVKWMATPEQCVRSELGFICEAKWMGLYWMVEVPEWRREGQVKSISSDFILCHPAFYVFHLAPIANGTSSRARTEWPRLLTDKPIQKWKTGGGEQAGGEWRVVLPPPRWSGQTKMVERFNMMRMELYILCGSDDNKVYEDMLTCSTVPFHLSLLRMRM